MSKFIARAVGAAATFAPLTAFAQYYDDYYYDDYYYDDYSTGSDAVAAGLGIGMIIFAIIAGLIGLAFLILWIVMLVDCVKREFEQRNTWLIILIASFFLNLTWLSAILYYFMVKRKNLGSKAAPAPAPKAPEPPKTEAPKQ